MKKFLESVLIFSFICCLVFSSCVSTPAASGDSSGGGSKSSGGSQPPWIKNPSSVYPDSQYVTATGDGKTAEEAQHKAKANLLQIFGMKLADESVISDTYSQTTVNDKTDWSESVSSARRISASAEGILAGCEIKEQWKNASGTEHHALALMEKAKTRDLYNGIIARLSQNINDALNIPNRNTIDGYSRTKIAAMFAKDIDSCVNVLSFVGGTKSVPAGLKTESQYLVDAKNIISSIPVNVVITRGANLDGEGRIQSAFAKSLGAVGFRTGTATSPYRLEVTLALSPVELAGQTNKFARYEITANLIQVSTTQGVVPAYSINGRAGHATESEARQRAIRDAEAKINEEYKELLEESLSQL